MPASCLVVSGGETTTLSWSAHLVDVLLAHCIEPYNVRVCDDAHNVHHVHRALTCAVVDVGLASSIGAPRMERGNLRVVQRALTALNRIAAAGGNGSTRILDDLLLVCVWSAAEPVPHTTIGQERAAMRTIVTSMRTKRVHANHLSWWLLFQHAWLNGVHQMPATRTIVPVLYGGGTAFATHCTYVRGALTAVRAAMQSSDDGAGAVVPRWFEACETVMRRAHLSATTMALAPLKRIATPFYEALASACAYQWDRRGAADEPLDAWFDAHAQLAQLVHQYTACAPRAPHWDTRMRATWRVPHSDPECVAQCARAHVPLSLFGVTPQVIDELETCHAAYDSASEYDALHMVANDGEWQQHEHARAALAHKTCSHKMSTTSAALGVPTGTPSGKLIGVFVHWLASISLYQLQVVHAFATLVSDCANLYTLPLPEHLARQHVAALARRYPGLDARTLHNALRVMVCGVCRTFRGHTVSNVNMVSASDVTIGAELATLDFSPCLTVAQPPSSPLPSSGSSSSSSSMHDVYVRQQSEHERNTALMLVDNPALFDAPPLLHETRDQMARMEREMARVHAPDTFAQALATTTTTSSSLGREPVRQCAYSGRWTCASRKAKDERKKTDRIDVYEAETEVSMRDAVTRVERDAIRTKADMRRRTSVRKLASYEACARTPLLDFNMVGRVLVLDKEAYVACCHCLSFTSLRIAVWRTDTLLCVQCAAARRDAHRLEDAEHYIPYADAPRSATRVGVRQAGAHSLSLVACRKCNVQCEPRHCLVVRDDYAAAAVRRVRIVLCDTHAKHYAAWWQDADTLMALSTIDRVLRTNARITKKRDE